MRRQRPAFPRPGGEGVGVGEVGDSDERKQSDRAVKRGDNCYGPVRNKVALKRWSHTGIIKKGELHLQIRECL